MPTDSSIRKSIVHWAFNVLEVQHIGVVLASTALGLFVFYLATSGQHFMEPIRYALRDVPADQFWYFGAPPAAIITSVVDLFRDPFIPTTYGFAVLLFAICFLAYRRTRNY